MALHNCEISFFCAHYYACAVIGLSWFPTVQIDEIKQLTHSTSSYFDEQIVSTVPVKSGCTKSLHKEFKACVNPNFSQAYSEIFFVHFLENEFIIIMVPLTLFVFVPVLVILAAQCALLQKKQK